MRKQSAPNKSSDSVKSSASNAEKEAFILDKALAACRRPWWQGVSVVALTGGMILGSASTSRGVNSFSWNQWTSGPEVFESGANWKEGTSPDASALAQILNFGTLSGPTGGLVITVNGGTYSLSRISVALPNPSDSITFDLPSDGTLNPTLVLQAGSGTGPSIDVEDTQSLTLSAGIALSLASDLLINSGSVSTGSIVLAGTVSGTKSITVTQGAVTLSGPNNYSGGTVVDGGLLTAGGTSAFGAGDITVNAGTIDIAGTSQTTGGSLNLKGGLIADTVLGGALTTSAYNVESGTVGAVLAGTASLSKTTVGTVALTALNTYTGDTTVTGGSLIVGDGTNAAKVGGGVLTVAGSSASVTLAAEAGLQTVSGLVLDGGSINGGAIDAGTGTFDLRSGNLGAALVGAGTLNKTTQGTVTLTGASIYAGETNITGGALIVGTSTATIGTGTLTVNGIGSKIDIQGTPQTISGDLVVKAGGTVDDTAGAGSLAAASFDLQEGTVNAVLTGDGGIVKSGAGTVSLNSANTFTGASSINEGVVIVGTSGALGTGGVTLSGGTSGVATVTLAAKDNAAPYEIGNAITSQGAVAFGTATNAGTLVLSGRVTLDGVADAVTADKWDVASGTSLKLTAGLAVGAGTVSFEKTGGGSLQLDAAAAGAQFADFKISQGTVIVGAVGALGTSDGTSDVGITLNGGALQVNTAPMVWSIWDWEGQLPPISVFPTTLPSLSTHLGRIRSRWGRLTSLRGRRPLKWLPGRTLGRRVLWASRFRAAA